jgi:hypothetical protein
MATFTVCSFAVSICRFYSERSPAHALLLHARLLLRGGNVHLNNAHTQGQC